MAIRYVLFDAVGTLIYPKPSVAAAYAAAAKTHGIQLAVSEIKVRFAAAYARIFQHATDLRTDAARERQRWRAVVVEVFHEWPHVVDELLEHLWQHFACSEHWPLFEDVLPIWTKLTARGYELGIASNFDARLRHVIQGHACLSSCRHVFVSTELGYVKPSELFFTTIQQRLNAQPEEFMLVGDEEEHDGVAPRRVGWQSQVLDRTGLAEGALLTLNDLADFLP